MSQANHDWRARAACRGLDLDAFFDNAWKGGTQGSPGPCLDAARTVCRSCPVQDECLMLALTTDTADGVWAGLTPPELRDLKRRMGLRSRYLTRQA